MKTLPILAFTLFYLIAPAFAQEKPSMPETKPLIRHFNPPTLSQPTRYSHVAEVRSDARFVYFSGQVAQDASGAVVGKGDIRAQTRQVFANVQAALQAVGGDWSNVVKITSYIVGAENIEAFREVREEMLKNVNPRPASTAVVVQKLFGDEWLVEMEAVVALPTKPVSATSKRKK